MLLGTQTRSILQMETIAQQYLTKLRIIAKIPENGQLDLTNNDLNIYSPGFASWVHRKIHGDGKLNTVGFLQKFYQEVTGFTTDLIQSAESDQNRDSKNRKHSLLASLASNILESITGIENLGKTYRSYPKITSNLETIQKDIIEPQLATIRNSLPYVVAIS